MSTTPSSSSSSSSSSKQLQNDLVKDTKLHLTCENNLEKILIRSDKAHKLLDAIENLGCKIPKTFFACRSCGEQEVSGGIVIDTTAANVASPKVLLFCVVIVVCFNCNHSFIMIDYYL
jgi:hypothetical protein